MGIDAPASEFEAPILFISGSQEIGFTEKEVATLRAYIDNGGTILAEPTDRSPQFRESMQQLVKDAKGSVQSPKSIDFVDAIPLTPVGKPDKKAVKATYWEGKDRGVG